MSKNLGLHPTWQIVNILEILLPAAQIQNLVICAIFLRRRSGGCWGTVCHCEDFLWHVSENVPEYFVEFSFLSMHEFLGEANLPDLHLQLLAIQLLINQGVHCLLLADRL